MVLTLTLWKGEAAPKKRQPRVLFLCWSEHFDPEQCVSQTEFTVNPNEEHVLLIANAGRITSVKLGDPRRIRNDDQQPSRSLAYSICMKQPDMSLTVGLRTPLSLLLKSGYLNIVPFFVTHDEYMVLAYKKIVQ